MMTKFVVLIDGSTKTITLDRTLLLPPGARHLVMRNPTVFWEYRNVTKALNALNLGGQFTVINEGYYDFDQLKRIFPTGSSIGLREYNGTSYITNSTSGYLTIHSHIMKMLGFESQLATSDALTTIHAGNSAYSLSPVDINLGLRYVKIRVDAAQSNVFNESGLEDSILGTLPVMTTQSLFGSVQTYQMESKTQIRTASLNSLKFSVTDQDDKPINIGKILMELSIE